jgi:SNF2 family DNA or RNA helicase
MSDATTTTDDVRFATTWRPDFAVDVDVWRWGDAALATGQSPTSMVETVSLTLRDVRPKVATPLGGRLPAASPTQVVSLSARCQAPRVKSYSFRPCEDNDVLPFASCGSPSGPARTLSSPAVLEKHRRTRIRPPEDVVKLQDRLHYLLQPSLESLLSDNALSFPFQPFSYQLDGVAFLFPRHTAVLADEMGLGKTMQAITAVRLLVRTGELRRVLLVCPKPLVTNWVREFSLWSPELPVAVIEGDQARRRWQWHEVAAAVKIANYELLVRDRELVEHPEVHFDLVMLDEAQRIKNRSGTTSQTVRAISRTRNWALTGTPVENSPEDLVGIFEFLSPGYLSRHMKPWAMGRAVADHILRRTKQQVLTDLPPKLIRDAELELTSEQRATYDLAENDGVLHLAEMGEAVTIQHVFELVLRLKQVCNFDPATGASAKLERLTADLEEVAASGQKALVFSQWVQTLDKLKHHLRPFGPLEYHGGIPSGRRDDVLRRFEEDPDRHVLLMSYGAGAVGLNLQFAGYVFLFDRWWNPAVEDQAINRAHRLGAAGPVTVTRFVTRSTIEERIDQVLREKRELFDMILSGAAPAKLGMSQEEIFGLFKLAPPSHPLAEAA